MLEGNSVGLMEEMYAIGELKQWDDPHMNLQK